MTESQQFAASGGYLGALQRIRTRGIEIARIKIPQRTTAWSQELSNDLVELLAQLAGAIAAESAGEDALMIAQNAINASTSPNEHEAITAIRKACPTCHQLLPVVHESK